MKRRGHWNKSSGTGGGGGGKQKDVFDKFQPTEANYTSDRATRTLLVSGLGPGCDEAALRAALGPHARLGDVLLLPAQGLALVDCASAAAAHAAVAQTGGHTIIAGAPAALAYSTLGAAEARLRHLQKQQQEYLEQQQQKQQQMQHQQQTQQRRPVVDDWTCAGCGGHNFARREACYRCGLARGAPAPGARTALVVRGLSVVTGEAAVAAWAGGFGHVAQVHLARDRHTGAPRGVAVVRYASAADARAAIHALRSGSAPPTIDGREVSVGWASERQYLDVAPLAQEEQQGQAQQGDGWQTWMYAACAMAAAAAAAGEEEGRVSLADSLDDNGGGGTAAAETPHKQFRVLPSSWDSAPAAPAAQELLDDSSGLCFGREWGCTMGLTRICGAAAADVDAALDDFYSEITEAPSAGNAETAATEGAATEAAGAPRGIRELPQTSCMHDTTRLDRFCGTTHRPSLGHLQVRARQSNRRPFPRPCVSCAADSCRAWTHSTGTSRTPRSMRFAAFEIVHTFSCSHGGNTPPAHAPGERVCFSEWRRSSAICARTHRRDVRH